MVKIWYLQNIFCNYFKSCRLSNDSTLDRKGKELEKSILEAKAERFMGGPKMDDEMFQTYRGSTAGAGVDTDTDTGDLYRCWCFDF